MNGPPRPAVALTFADGHRVVIRLQESIVGAQIETEGSAGTASRILAGGVAKLPLTLH